MQCGRVSGNLVATDRKARLHFIPQITPAKLTSLKIINLQHLMSIAQLQSARSSSPCAWQTLLIWTLPQEREQLD